MSSALGGLLGGLGGGGGGGGGSGVLGMTENQLGQAFGQITGTMAASKEAEKARDWQKGFWQEQLYRGPSWRMYGLQKAGLNPILAAQGGLGVGGGTGGASAAAMAHPPSSSPRGGAQAAQTMALLSAQVKKAEAEAWQAQNSAKASELMPGRAWANLAFEEWQALNSEVQNKILRTSLPERTGSARFYGHPAGQAVQRWNIFMRNVFGGGAKPMPIYRGK